MLYSVVTAQQACSTEMVNSEIPPDVIIIFYLPFKKIIYSYLYYIYYANIFFIAIGVRIM